MLRLKESFFNKIEINDLNDISIPIPWILIWKLLVSKEYRNKGYWNNLIIAIMSYCYDISQKIWIRFIIVDANKNAIWFYKKHWFIELSDNSETTKMVFDLKQFD
jgi:GNAT superfamily N-acetyltransferase